MIVKEENRKQVLQDLLSAKQIPIEQVTRKLEIKEKGAAVFLYTSYFEGLGNEESDIDVYVIHRNKIDQVFPFSYSSCEGVNTFDLNSLTFDTEYWKYESLMKSLEEIYKRRENFIDTPILKMLLRLKYSCVIEKNELGSEILGKINEINIEQCVKNRYLLLARSFYDDAFKMFRMKEYIVALDCCRRALWEVIGALNAQMGHANLKEKWISKIYINNDGYGKQEFLKKYLHFQMFSNIQPENLARDVEYFLEYIQEMITFTNFNA